MVHNKLTRVCSKASSSRARLVIIQKIRDAAKGNVIHSLALGRGHFPFRNLEYLSFGQRGNAVELG
jgi:hypothetical protein